MTTATYAYSHTIVFQTLNKEKHIRFAIIVLMYNFKLLKTSMFTRDRELSLVSTDMDGLTLRVLSLKTLMLILQKEL